MIHEPTAPVVEMTSVHKAFGTVKALDGVDLRITRGECVAILGPNGAGKTTAVSLMLGMREPTSGMIRFLGLPPGSRAARSRRGAMLQDSGVPATLTVRELVDLFRAYYPAPMAAADALDLAGPGGPVRHEGGRPLGRPASAPVLRPRRLRQPARALPR